MKHCDVLCLHTKHTLNIAKELSLWNKIKYLNLEIFRTRSCKPLIFQTQIIWSNRIHSLKYLRSATFGCKDIVIRKSEFVAKTQFLCFQIVVVDLCLKLTCPQGWFEMRTPSFQTLLSSIETMWQNIQVYTTWKICIHYHAVQTRFLVLVFFSIFLVLLPCYCHVKGERSVSAKWKEPYLFIFSPAVFNFFLCVFESLSVFSFQNVGKYTV